MARQFHQTTDQLLFLCKIARPDIETLVSFLTTRVKEPDVENWGKLRHGLMYLKGNLYMKLYLIADSLSNIVWLLDGSFGVHWDSKGHTGAMMSMGKGAIVNISRKHKMNVAISTESELVSIADVIGVIMWWKYFMEAQDYMIENNILYQDNKSTILLANNGRMSAGKNSNHIKNRFFLISEEIAQGELDIRNMGTKFMWADDNTKPVHGALFRIFQSDIMGMLIEYNYDVERRRTHLLLLPIIETERVSLPDGDILKKIAVVVPVEKVSKPGPVDKKRSIQDRKRKSISPKAKTSEKQSSVLGEPKYG